MDSPNVQKMLVIGVAVILVLGLGYMTYIKEPGILDSSVIPLESETAGQDILILVGKMERISIDTALFSGPLFSNLVDFSQNIFPETYGRPNPFASVNIVAGSQKASSTAVR